MLWAVAVAQVQSIFIATVATSGYLVQGNISIPLAVLVSGSLLASVVVRWRVGHVIDPDRLKVALAVVLITVGPYSRCDRCHLGKR